MASAEELTDQLTMMTRLASQVERMAAASDRIERSYQTQVSIVEKLADAFGRLNTQGPTQGVEVLGKAVKEVQDRLRDTGKASEATFQRLSKEADRTGRNFSSRFPRSVAVGTAALSGFAQGVRNVVALSKGVTGFLTGFVDGVANVAASIIAIPFKIFEGLVDLAARSGNGMNELAQEIENLRKQFGALSGPTNKAIVTTAENLTGFKDTGLSAWRVFGNLANRLKEIRELATEMGGAFGVVRKEFVDNGGALLAYQKGLGIANDDMRGVARSSVAMGRQTSTALKDMTRYSYELGDAFGLDAKLISRDMSKALSDVRHFGGATVKQIAEASTYARKLGFELKDITGTLDAFDTFDAAAENAAKLSQAFGVNIDAFELMKAQNPADQLELLRKSFRQAGVDASNFDRASLKLAATTTGLSEDIVQSALSLKNQGMRLDEIKKKSGEAERKTMTQAQAMKRLADAIERMVIAGGPQEGGFWDMFIKGFLGGIQSSKEFREIIWNIKRALQQTYLEGVRLGRAFVQLFPGVKDFLGGIAGFFNPAKFKRLTGSVVDVITSWMKDLSDPNGKASFAGLMGSLRDSFFNFFNEESPDGRRLLDGFKRTLRSIGRIVGEGISWASDKVADGLRLVMDLITGKRRLLDGAAAAGKDGLGFMGEVLAPVVDGLRHAWKEITPVLADMVRTLGQKLAGYLRSDAFTGAVKPAIPYVATVLFGPALARAMLGALAASMAKSAVGFFTGSGRRAVSDLVQRAGDVASAARRVPTTGVDGIERVGAVNKAVASAVDAGRGWGVREAATLGLKLVAVATALSVGGVEMAYAFGIMKRTLDAAGIRTTRDVLPPMEVLGAVVLASVPLSLSLRLASRAGNVKDVLLGGLVVTAAVGIVGTVGAGLTALLSAVGSPEQLTAAGDVMLKMSGVFLAMVPLIGASIALGALASGPQAAALVLAAAGMAVVGAAVAEMSGISVAIIKQLAGLRVDAGFQTKVDAFLGIMRSVQAFTQSLVSVIDMMEPSLAELLTGRSESFTAKVTAARGLMREMIGSRGSGDGVVGIVETVMDSLKQLSLADGLVEKARTFSEVLSAVAATMAAMVPPPAFFEAGSSFLAQLSGPKPFTDLATDVNYYMTKMRDGIMSMVRGDSSGKGGIIDVVQQLGSIQLPNAKAAETVAALLGAISGVMKSLAPSGDTLKAFTTSVDNALVAVGPLKLGATNVSKLDAAALGKALDAMGEQMGKLLPALTTGVLGSVLQQAGTVAPDQVEKLKVMADVLRSSVEAGRLVADALRGGEQAIKVDPAALDGLGSTLPRALSVVARLQEQVGGGLSSASLRSFGRNMQELAGVIHGDEQGKGGIVGALSAVREMVKQANDLDAALAAASTNRIDIKARLDRVARAVGLGGKMTYTVNPSKEIAITVNMTVTMEAGAVERVILQREGSVIRDRLNFATYDNVGERATSPVPNTPDAPAITHPAGTRN